MATKEVTQAPEENLQVYSLPELGIAVEASSVEDAVKKAKKLTENK